MNVVRTEGRILNWDKRVLECGQNRGQDIHLEQKNARVWSEQRA